MTTLHSSFIRAPECKCRHKNDEIPSQPEHLSLSLRLPYLDILKKLLSSAAGRRRTWGNPTEWHSDDCSICTTQAHTHFTSPSSTQQVQFTELLDVQTVATGHTRWRRLPKYESITPSKNSTQNNKPMCSAVAHALPCRTLFSENNMSESYQWLSTYIELFHLLVYYAA